MFMFFIWRQIWRHLNVGRLRAAKSPQSLINPIIREKWREKWKLSEIVKYRQIWVKTAETGLRDRLWLPFVASLPNTRMMPTIVNKMHNQLHFIALTVCWTWLRRGLPKQQKLINFSLISGLVFDIRTKHCIITNRLLYFIKLFFLHFTSLYNTCIDYRNYSYEDLSAVWADLWWLWWPEGVITGFSAHSSALHPFLRSNLNDGIYLRSTQRPSNRL